MTVWEYILVESLQSPCDFIVLIVEFCQKIAANRAMSVSIDMMGYYNRNMDRRLLLGSHTLGFPADIMIEKPTIFHVQHRNQKGSIYLENELCS